MRLLQLEDEADERESSRLKYESDTSLSRIATAALREDHTPDAVAHQVEASYTLDHQLEPLGYNPFEVISLVL